MSNDKESPMAKAYRMGEFGTPGVKNPRWLMSYSVAKSEISETELVDNIRRLGGSALHGIMKIERVNVGSS